MVPTRRDSLKALATTVGSIAVWPYLSDHGARAFVEIQQTQAAPSRLVFTSAEYAAVELLSEAIIPVDERSPGARAARVADYIDLLLNESDAATRLSWSAGLGDLDRLARQRFGTPTQNLSTDRITVLLTEISRNELSPVTSLEKFFVMLKEATIRGYYTSEIGIQQELRYQGNRFLTEFVGCTHPEHGYTPGA
jgi:hypothetical protein